MRLNQLAYLTAMIREGTFAGAARCLFVSPQAVAKSLHALEDELGVPLFEKAGAGVKPTPFARAFAVRADELLRDFDDLQAFAAGYAAPRHARLDYSLSVVSTPHRCSTFEDEDFAELRRAHPLLRLEIRYLSNDACASAMKNGLVDAAVLQGRIDKPGIECRKITSLRVHAAMTASHRLAENEGLSLHDLDEAPVALPLDMSCTLPLIQKRCRADGVKPRFVDIGADMIARDRFLQDGGIVLVSRGGRMGTAPLGCRIIPFMVEERLAIPLYLAWRGGANGARLYAYLVNRARSHAGQCG